LLAVALGCAVLAAAMPAAASSSTTAPEQRQREIDQEMARLQRQLGESSAQQARLLAELQVSRRSRAALDAKVAGIDAQIAAAQHDLDGVTAELDAASAAEETAIRAVDDAQRQLRRATAALRDHAIASYIHSTDAPSLSDMLSQLEDVNDAPRVATYVKVVASRQAAIIDQHRQIKQDMSELEAKAEAAKAEVGARQQQVTARRAALQEARDDQAAARAQVAAETDREQKLLDQVRAQRAADLKEYDELQRESSSIAADLARRQSGQTAPAAGHGVVGYPVANPVITSTFGYRIHPIYGDRRLHAGVDFAANTGTPVFAGKEGTVVTAGWMSGYGNTVVIDHGGALATLYAHNSQLLVSVGQTVTRGQKIALAGSTGNSTGPHVHFEVRVKGTPVDPMNYL
jgi:murein DD-endopeptidase MepM/ murein hydrolase activator NlpD